MNIQKNALLVRLTIHSWSDERRSHEVEEAGAKEYSAHRNRLRAVKKLIVSPLLQDLKNAQKDMYNAHRRLTLPWEDGEARLVTCQAYQLYLDTIRKCATAVSSATTALADEWDNLIEKAKKEEEGLGRLWKLEDYLTAEELKERIGHEISFKPVPSSGDVRVEGLSEEDIQKIKDEIEEQSKEREKQAGEAVWEKIYQAAAHLKKRVEDLQKDPKGTRFHQSTLDNIVSLAEILPAINLMNDPEVNEVSAHILGNLRGKTKEDLREKPFDRGVAVGVAIHALGKGPGRTRAESEVLQGAVKSHVETMEAAQESSNDFMRNFKKGE